MPPHHQSHLQAVAGGELEGVVVVVPALAEAEQADPPVVARLVACRRRREGWGERVRPDGGQACRSARASSRTKRCCNRREANLQPSGPHSPSSSGHPASRARTGLVVLVTPGVRRRIDKPGDVVHPHRAQAAGPAEDEGASGRLANMQRRPFRAMCTCAYSQLRSTTAPELVHAITPPKAPHPRPTRLTR